MTLTLNTIIALNCYLLLRLDLKHHRHNNVVDYLDHILLCTNHPKNRPFTLMSPEPVLANILNVYIQRIR